MHVYTNFRKCELCYSQNILFLIVFSILFKTLNATYLYSIHYLQFYHCFLIQLLASISNKDIFML